MVTTVGSVDPILLGRDGGGVRIEKPTQRSSFLVRLIREVVGKILAWIEKRQRGDNLAQSIEKGDEAEALRLIALMSEKELGSQRKEPFLFQATRKGRVQVVAALCTKLTPEQIRFRTQDGTNAFLIAKALGHSEAMPLLKNHFSLEERISLNHEGYTSLMTDIEDGRYERAIQAISKMELHELNFIAKNGKSAFSIAAESGDERADSVLQMLIPHLPLSEVLGRTLPSEKFPKAEELLRKRKVQGAFSLFALGSLTPESSVARAHRNIYFDRNVRPIIAGFMG